MTKISKVVAAGVLALMLLSHPIYASDTSKTIITLEEAKNIAFEKNSDLKMVSSTYDKMIAEANKSTEAWDIARHNTSSYGASLQNTQATISNLYTQITNKNAQIAAEADPTARLQLENEKQDLLIQINQYEAGLSGKMASYGSAVVTADMSKNTAESYRNLRDDTERRILDTKKILELNVERLYLAGLGNRDRLRVAEEALARAESLVKIEQLKLDYGLSNKLMVQSMLSVYKQARVDNDKAKDAYEAGKLSLNKLLGRGLDEPLELVEPKLEAVPLENDTYGLENALKETLDIKAKKRTAEEREKEYKDDDSKYYQISKTNSLNAKIELENAKDNVKSQYEQCKDKYRMTKDLLELSRLYYDTAKFNAETSKLRFELGMITAIDHKKTEVDLISASANLKTAEYNYYLAAREYYLLQNGVPTGVAGMY